MGLMLLSEMQTDIRLQLGQRTNVDPSTVAGLFRLRLWINRANRWMCNPSVFRHPGMKKNAPIVLDQALTRYPLPANLFAIRFVINETKGDEYDPEKEHSILESTSRERRFARDGTDIILRVTEASDGDTLRVYYWAKPKLLSDDGHRTEVEEYFDEVLVQRATGAGCAALGQVQRADYFNAHAAQLVNEMREAEVFEALNEGWENDLRNRDPYQRWSR